ncbi:MAG TPA: type II secretion system protein GspD [Nitrospirales bacterium]|nr:type II secretion system protein GspD [Nitrospirales bacterium]
MALKPDFPRFRNNSRAMTVDVRHVSNSLPSWGRWNRVLYHLLLIALCSTLWIGCAGTQEVTAEGKSLHAASTNQPRPSTPSLTPQALPLNEGLIRAHQKDLDTESVMQDEQFQNAVQETAESLTPFQQASVPTPHENPEKVVLNFDNAELHKVIKILSAVLQIDYLIDPKVKGTVNLHVNGEIAKTDLLSLFNDIIRINRAALIKIGPIHHIVPMTATVNSQLPIVSHPHNAGEHASPHSGVEIHLVPLRYIAPTEIEKVIKPFLSSGSHFATYEKSRLLLFTEFADNVETIRSLITLFDTNVFEQVSVRLYPIRLADVSDITQELEKIFSAFELPTKSGVGVGISLVPIPRTNMLLAISSIPESFDLVEHWLEQLDKQTGGTEIQTYIYHVKNGIAEELAEILNSVFIKTESKGGPARTAALTAQPQTSHTPGTQAELTGEVKIIPYATTNTLIIKANPRDFDVVRGVLEELDIMPRQVLIEVMIAEVTLKENLEYGIAYSFLTKGDSTGPRLRGSTTGTLSADVLKIDAGERVNLLAQLRAHADESIVRVLASPHLLVTDGKEASLEIGDEIAIRTAVSEGPGVEPGAAEATVRKDTGTILKITPIINSTGLVTIDLDLEKSVVNAPALGSRDVTISKRQAVTSMVVQDGETILVGGLIDETVLDTIVKVPILGDIPYLGNLFRRTTTNKSRIELILLITPHVIRDISDASEITAGFVSKVHAIQDLMAARGY